MNGVLVVGDVINDVIVLPRGPESPDSDVASTVSSVPGGSGANQATWLAALGVTVRLAACVGAADAAVHRRDLAAAGVDARLSVDPDLATGCIVVLIGGDGNRSMYTDRGANTNLHRLDADLLDDMTHLHVSGRSFVTPPTRPALAVLWAAAGSMGLTRSVDVGSAAFVREFGPSFLDWTDGADVLFANLAEGRIVAGVDDSTDQEAVMTQLLSHYPLVALTLGAGGSVVATRAERVARPEATTTIVDPTGAGDAFCAGFLARWLDDAALAPAADSATATAARALMVFGSRPAPEPGIASGPPWETLRRAAIAVAADAHAPYSGLRVGAAGITADGQVVTGCNVENASFGLTLCAECGLVSALRAAGAHRLVAVTIVAHDGRPLAPCGRCRQLLYDNGGSELLIDQGPTADPVRLAALLPHAFGPDDVPGAGAP